MKTTVKCFTLVLACTCMSLATLAANGEAGHPEGRPTPPDHETRLLQQLLKMDEVELTNLRKTIQRIEKMSPEEKELLSKRIGKLHNMDPKHIESMRNKYKAIPEEDRIAMRKRWMSMTAEERKAWRKKLSTMSLEERATVFKEEGFMPMRKPKGSKQANEPEKERPNKDDTAPRREGPPAPSPAVVEDSH
ncbi:MAG TPA: hypothetical protein DCX06_09270 [Opitutae bacterium]|nr:hypothetical protein [Opitutae bacterium]